MSELTFLDPSFQIRWSKLTAEVVEPSITQALNKADEVIQRIATQNPKTLTYASTLLALEEAVEPLTQAWGKVSHLQSVADSPELRAAYNKMLPLVSTFYTKIRLDPQLWSRIKTFAESTEAQKLQGIHKRFLNETLADFKEAGADLPPAPRTRLEALQTELAELTQKYSEHVLDATNAFELIVDDEARLKGLPEHAKRAALESAISKGKATSEKLAWRFTLHAPSMEPFMTYLEDAELRQKLWTASSEVGARAPYDNAALIVKILSLRSEKASLLGKAHFADQVLERRMAKTGEKALAFMEDIGSRASKAFKKECDALERFKAKLTNAAVSALAPWDIAFYSEKLRQSQYAFDEEALRPYFKVENVISGLFKLATQVFGLTITERTDLETWHKEVKCYEMRNASNVHVGSFYADWHPRESKRGGAWMNYLITGGPKSDGSRLPHLGLICGNLTAPSSTGPALLTHREVETIFHEFGHLLHHLLGEVEIKSLNGVNVAWDFVELPSQIMENWCWEREGLDLFARHHQSGEVIPEDLFKKMTQAKQFRSACMTMRQVALAKMDLLLHINTAEFSSLLDLESRLRSQVIQHLIPTKPKAPTVIKRFTHVFADPVGYAAGYYSYKWAEVLDADAFTRFKKEGIFNSKTGADFVRTILSKGNSEDPAKLFKDFMGRDPDIQALLIRAGLTG